MELAQLRSSLRTCCEDEHFVGLLALGPPGLGKSRLRIELEADPEKRTAEVEIPGVLTSSGRPIVNHFNGEPFHIALARRRGSFEFTYAEIGLGTTSVTGDLEMAFEDSWAHYCVHHFDQDGLVRERSRLTAWLDR